MKENGPPHEKEEMLSGDVFNEGMNRSNFLQRTTKTAVAEGFPMMNTDQYAKVLSVLGSRIGPTLILLLERLELIDNGYPESTRNKPPLISL